MANFVVRGLNHFIFFNAHFLSVNVFQGEGVVKLSSCKLSIVLLRGDF